MKLSKEEKEICRKYSKRDMNGLVHCKECPLVINKRLMMCKKNTRKKDLKEL